MLGPRIVTALVLISLSVGCKAKFRAVDKAAEPTANLTQDQGTQNAPTEQNPQNPQNFTPAPPPPQNFTPKNPAVCATTDDQTLDPARTTQNQTVTFNRGRQLVERRDCSNKLISKKYEILNGNTMKKIVVRPSGSGALSVYNRNTCHAASKQAIIPVSSSGSYSFTVSLKKTDFAMVVRPGLNYIDYNIGQEQGTLVLTVVESETEQECVVIRPGNCPKAI
jgi:hypothetical protein